MTADEMLEELGYKKWMTKNRIGYWCNRLYIEFDFDTKSLVLYNDDDNRKFTISTELHKAITKKMEELGWL